MRMLWKVLLVCLVSLPVGVYVASTLISSTADGPDRRAPIVIEQPASSGSTAGRSPSRRPTSDARDDDSDERGDGDRDDRDDRVDRVDTVNPSPDEVDDTEDRVDDRGDDGGQDDGQDDGRDDEGDDEGDDGDRGGDDD
jgi:hypothetical protein